jgi:hypothetical protein
MNGFQETAMKNLAFCGVSCARGDQAIQESATEIYKEYFRVDMSLPIAC